MTTSPFSSRLRPVGLSPTRHPGRRAAPLASSAAAALAGAGPAAPPIPANDLAGLPLGLRSALRNAALAAPAPARPSHPLRKVDIAFLAPDGRGRQAARAVPALPAFEAAFAAFARGTLIATAAGPVAVEDLRPGTGLRTAGGEARTLLWRGSTTVVPAAGLPAGARDGAQDGRPTRLTRLGAEALGVDRPSHHLVLGPHARVVSRGLAVRAAGLAAALVPAADLVDGASIVAVAPAAPVEVFHLGLARHAILLADGVEVESVHPGPPGALGLDDDLLALWLGCFPHVQSLADFGELALPRLASRDLDAS